MMRLQYLGIFWADGLVMSEFRAALLLRVVTSSPRPSSVSAAGITREALFLKMEEDDFDRVIQVNLKVAST